MTAQIHYEGLEGWALKGTAMRKFHWLALAVFLLLQITFAFACGQKTVSPPQPKVSNQSPISQAEPRLIQCVRNDDAVCVQRLLADGSSANVKDRDGSTALMISAIKGNKQIVETLINSGADVNFVNTNTEVGATPLAMAIIGNREEIIYLLLAKGANPNAKEKNGLSVLHRAVEQGNIRIVTALLGKGADPNLKENILGKTPLFSALANNLEITKELLDKGADVNARSNAGWTPLMEAVNNQSTIGVRLLLAHGANVNAKDKDEWTALKQAYLIGCSDIIDLLQKNGASE